ncbi:MAG: LysE family translocator [Luminiphilus sp.]|nr:LysE family translocator [Luminiphilus sp.]
MNPELLILFIPTIALVSLTPGMCMMLAFSLGISEGYRRTVWMMMGELLGVALVVTATVWLLQNMMSLDPGWFRGLMLIGACYLLWIARQLWISEPQLERADPSGTLSPLALLTLGFTTAIMNPKGWAFMLALLPGFMVQGAPLASQILTFLSVILVSEFLSMSIYALGGQWLRRRFTENMGLQWLNKLAAGMMVVVSTLVLF